MKFKVALASDVSTIEQNFALFTYSHDQLAVSICNTTMIGSDADASQQYLFLSRTVAISDIDLFAQREEVTDRPGQDWVLVDIENMRLSLAALLLGLRAPSFGSSLLLRLLELLLPTLGHLGQHLLILCHFSRHFVFQLLLHRFFLFLCHDSSWWTSTSAHLLLQSLVLLLELLDQHFGWIDVDLWFILDLLGSISISECAHRLFELHHRAAPSDR
mmetsp:Transcript_3889/g.14191  ORF Transcript_3889/g.14191 Transcript_3889/m.14191 type:complete len:216 (-) Transcript_3889:1450-2097(-)